MLIQFEQRALQPLQINAFFKKNAIKKLNKSASRLISLNNIEIAIAIPAPYIGVKNVTSAVSLIPIPAGAPGTIVPSNHAIEYIVAKSNVDRFLLEKNNPDNNFSASPIIKK